MTHHDKETPLLVSRGLNFYCSSAGTSYTKRDIVSVAILSIRVSV